MFVMGIIFTSSSSSTFIFFAVAGSVIVYLILLFDKMQRRNLKVIISKTDDVQPLFMQKAADQKLSALKQLCNKNETAYLKLVSKQLNELVARYDKGQMSLPDYCSRLNRLLDQVS
jgi:hypothetical protein